ncbi:metallophosphoesterase MPPED2-like isoform X3 [Penaeus monodon]|uniref:metallophosphoesterase MPPED2-like isoform X2 n=1 Tax=Penaeus monodon TaxID=6687 RepID=UPI0018A7D622|nr:metallophosphoesterase MPPED2-like isoform X2 [Penaeus monodon]XP_037775320.1 metallophosphoesterase MPPED2-like isoform X3 [Penaeus monodon]
MQCCSSGGANMTESIDLSTDPNGAWEILKDRLTVDIVEPLPATTPISEDKVRFVCVSDTHVKTDDMTHPMPDGDVLLHSGDFTYTGSLSEAEKFNNWLGTLPYKHKVVIAGNHEIILDEDSCMKPRPAEEVITNATYLQDSSTTVYGFKIYGSPWTPEYHVMAFNLTRGEPLRNKWKKIPRDVDILMTHGPPLGYGDLTWRGDRAGCVDLMQMLQTKIKPKYHIYGHIHEGYGMTTNGRTNFINASTCDRFYKPVNAPLVFDLPLPSGVSKSTAELG